MYLGEPIPMMIKNESDDYDEINYNKKRKTTKQKRIYTDNKKRKPNPYTHSSMVTIFYTRKRMKVTLNFQAQDHP